jgi:transcriptional regulator with XRE-family HTH domain
MDEIKASVAKNITLHRKKLNLTQAQLAEKLNYSDKAISKWERAEAVPDVYILHEMAVLFGITVDELIGATPLREHNPKLQKHNHAVITLLSIGLVWLFATVVFVILDWCGVKGRLWLSFIYAIPVSAIVSIVFNGIWGKRLINTILVSVLIWTVAVSIYLTFSLTKTWLIYIVGIPLQILTILWYFLKKTNR